MSENYNNRTVVVTNAGAGPGREIACQLAKLGATVAVVDSEQVAALKTTSSIVKQGGCGKSYVVNLEDAVALKEAASLMSVELGQITDIYFVGEAMPELEAVLAQLGVLENCIRRVFSTKELEVEANNFAFALLN